MTEAAARHLGRVPQPEDSKRGIRTREESGHDDYLVRSPLVGEMSPIAPPIAWEVVDDRVVGHGTYHAAYEGPPGYVHGGWIALSFDEFLGMANIASGHPGMTGTLKIRYLRPTPLHRSVVIEGWTERVEGRRIVAKGRMTVDGEVTAEAEGLFVTISPELALEYFGRATGEASAPGVPPADL
jgi:acyl-coenzyme A thioesterase PaaI-like protein